MNGVVNLRKSTGVSSHDEVLRTRKILGISKIGHLGTLDPLATGVLPLCVGKATKLVPYLENSRKAYVATMRLGATTDTMDATGRVLETRPVGLLSRDGVVRTVECFCGENEQVPPMYSAVKVGGKRLYELARLGIEVERQPRKITVHRLRLKELRDDELTIEIECSKGTYVRTLCADIGQALGCGAFLQTLTRTRVGPFVLAESVSCDELQHLQEQGRAQEILWPLDKVLAGYPEIHVPTAVSERVRHGAPFSETALPQDTIAELTTGSIVRVYDPTGTLLALAELQLDQKDSRLPRVFRLARLLVTP